MVNLTRPLATIGLEAPDKLKWVFVSLSTCGHAQSVYADTPQSTGIPWDETIMGDLRAGLTVKRITLEDYRANYARMLLCGCPLCGCPKVGHEKEWRAAHRAKAAKRG